MVYDKPWRASIGTQPHFVLMKKVSIRNILVPVDFSALSILAIETAQRLGQRFGATIHLVHVHEFYYPAGFIAPGSAVPTAPMITFQEDATRRVTDELRALAEKHGIPAVNCYVRQDIPIFNEICAVAKEIAADLIVTPTHGRTGLKHVFLGSTAERLVQHSPCPVFVARQRKGKRTIARRSNGRSSIDTILVPVDFSECSRAGLRYAIEFASKVAAKIVVLHVVELGQSFTADGYAMYDLSPYREQARAGGEQQMAGFLRSVKFGGVKFESKVLAEQTLDGICDTAEEINADLIITATHGRTGLDHLLIGSTAEKVVRHAPCSVLVVPSHPQVRAATLRAGLGKASQKLARPITPVWNKTADSSKRSSKLTRHAFPERRRTNKFRESHLP